MEIEITKAIACEQCAEETPPVSSTMFYCGSSKISPTITLVAFKCEHGHHAKTECANDLAQRWIKAQKAIGIGESDRRYNKRRDDEHRKSHKPGKPERVTAPGRTAG